MNTNVILSDKAKEAKQLIQEGVKNKLFVVQFIKADGTLRRMRAQYGVRKGILGYGLPNTKENIIKVYDHNIKQHRSIDVNRIVSIDCGKLHWKAEK